MKTPADTASDARRGRGGKNGKRHAEPAPWWTATLTTFAGLLLGVFVTLSSVGAGGIGMTALVLLYPRTPIARLVGSDIAHAVPLTLIAGVGRERELI